MDKLQQKKPMADTMDLTHELMRLIIAIYRFPQISPEATAYDTTKLNFVT